MIYNLSDVKFITLKEDIHLGDVLIDKDIAVPLVLDNASGADSVNINSITSGLIKTLVYKDDDKNKDYYKALLLRINPQIAENLAEAERAKAEKKDWEFAEFLSLAVKEIRGNAGDYINLATLYAKMTVDAQKKEDYVKADFFDDKIREVLDECLRRYPNDAEPYREMSAFHLRHGDIENARDYLEKFVNASTDRAECAKAKKELEKYNKILEGNNQILYAYDKMMMGDVKTAMEECEKNIKDSGPSWEAYFILGWAKRTQGKYKEAMSDLLQSLSLDSDNAEVYNELSICARENGNRELSKTYLDIAVDLDGENIVFLTNLALLHLEDGEFDLSRKYIEKARGLDKDDPSLVYLIKEYEKKTGETLSDVIKTEVYSDEEFAALHKKEHEEGHHHHEI